MTALYNGDRACWRGYHLSAGYYNLSGFSPEYFKKEQFQDNWKTLWTKVKKFKIACNAGFAVKQHLLATFGLLFNICFEFMILLHTKDCLFLPAK